MRIDPRFFNLFLVSTAMISLLLILYFTFSYTAGQRTKFEDKVGDGKILHGHFLRGIGNSDSVHVGQYNGKIVVLDFWATWSPRAEESHKVLHSLQKQYPGRIVVLAASVKDDVNLVMEYRDRMDYDFVYVNGSDLFNELRTPGVPTQIILKDGKVLRVQVGYSALDEYDTLRKLLISNENGRI